MKKKPNRRSNAKFPALNPKLNLKTRNHLIDYDYVNQLSDKDKQWLNDFTAEYVNADFKTNVEEGRKRIHRKKKAEHPKNKHLKKLLIDFVATFKNLIVLLNRSEITNTGKSKLKKSVNKFKKQIKVQIKKEFKYIEDSYKSMAEYDNNHRNSCVMLRQKAMGILKSTEELPTTMMRKNDLENEIIENIDAKRLEILDEENDQ